MAKCDGFPKSGCKNDATNHILDYDLCRDCAVAFISDDELKVRLEVLKEILTDPVNQLEQTKGGHYIYRFDLETMRRIADAIGILRGDPVDMLNCYTLEELPRLIKPD